MGANDLNTKLTALIAPTVTGLGCNLWGIEYLPQGSHSVLRIYIDKENGVNLDDCEQISRQISALFDVEEPIHGQYHLEVSSPGVERPLFTRDQYSCYVGRTVKVRTHVPIEKRRKFQGILTEMTQDGVVLTIEDVPVHIPWDSIDKAQLCWNDEERGSNHE